MWADPNLDSSPKTVYSSAMTSPVGMRAPIAAINEACCTLACVEFFFADARPELKQPAAIDRLAPHFPHWGTPPGRLKPWELVYALGLLGCSPMNILMSANRDTAMVFRANHKMHGGFLFTHLPRGPRDGDHWLQF